MGKHAVPAGCGHAHLTLLVRGDEIIRQGHRMTIVSPSPYHYYSGMGPGMLGGIYTPKEIRFHIRKAAEDRGIQFIQGKILSVNAEVPVINRFAFSPKIIHKKTRQSRI